MNIKQIVQISLQYGRKMSPEEITKVFQLTQHEIKLDDNGSLAWGSRDIECTLEAAMQLGIPFEINKVLPYVSSNAYDEIADILANKQAGVGPINAKCNNVIVGAGAFSIKQVELLEDACTNALQDKLNNGWHILAICVQPNQRRPDYILGLL